MGLLLRVIRKKMVSYLFLSFLRLMQSQPTSIHGGRPRESRRSTLDLFSGDTNSDFNLPLLLLMLRLIWYLIEKQTAGVHGITPPAFCTCTHDRQVYFKWPGKYFLFVDKLCSIILIFVDFLWCVKRYKSVE